MGLFFPFLLVFFNRKESMPLAGKLNLHGLLEEHARMRGRFDHLSMYVKRGNARFRHCMSDLYR
jgi:hypothetical protein